MGYAAGLYAGSQTISGSIIGTVLDSSGNVIPAASVKLTSERADTDPKVFTKINFHFVVSGRNLKPAAVERAVKLSHEKYCSASIMLAKTAEITHSFEIVEAA